MASDLKKPDGLVVVEPGHEREFLAPLPVGRLWGVGPKTEAGLKMAGLERIGQIADLQHSELTARLGKTGAHLWQLAHGIDDRPVLPEEGFKSIGHEITFEHDTADPELLHATLLGLSGEGGPTSSVQRSSCADNRDQVPRSGFFHLHPANYLEQPGEYGGDIFPAAQKLLKPLLREGACSANWRLCQQPGDRGSRDTNVFLSAAAKESKTRLRNGPHRPTFRRPGNHPRRPRAQRSTKGPHVWDLLQTGRRRTLKAQSGFSASFVPSVTPGIAAENSLHGGIR